jgi:RNA polymerase sigma-70 factor (ECF subfamily)
VDQNELNRSDDRFALLEDIRSGDVTAFDRFLKSQWEPLVRYVTAHLGSVDDGKDIAQEAFLRLWEERAGLRHPGSLKGYLYRIARNLAINDVRRRQLHDRLNQERPVQSARPRTPAAELDQKELRCVVEQAIDALPARRKEAFILGHLQGLRHQEIAEVMGISPQSVANQISAALTTLRQTLAPYLGEQSSGSQRSMWV